MLGLPDRRHRHPGDDDRYRDAEERPGRVQQRLSQRPARIHHQQPVGVGLRGRRELSVGEGPGEADDVEVAGLDPAHGPRFYTLTVGTSGRPAIGPGDTCLHCHQGPNTDGVAGIYVGSVLPGPTGAPLRDETAIVTDHRTAFAERYGGWYVNARRGEPSSRANAVAANPADPETLVREVPLNLSMDAEFAGSRRRIAYERLLLDLIEGDQTLFVRRDEVEAQWRFVDSIRTGWEANGTKPKSYPSGSWGPSAAIALTERDGVTWQDD